MSVRCRVHSEDQLELMMTWGVASSLMVKMEKLGHPTVFC